MKTGLEIPATGKSLWSVKSNKVVGLEISLNPQTKRPENLAARGILQQSTLCFFSYLTDKSQLDTLVSFYYTC
jgi:hypothetical protein